MRKLLLSNMVSSVTKAFNKLHKKEELENTNDGVEALYNEDDEESVNRQPYLIQLMREAIFCILISAILVYGIKAFLVLYEKSGLDTSNIISLLGSFLIFILSAIVTNILILYVLTYLIVKINYLLTGNRTSLEKFGCSIELIGGRLFNLINKLRADKVDSITIIEITIPITYISFLLPINYGILLLIISMR